MGYCADATPAMGPFSIETRNESFYLVRDHDGVWDYDADGWEVEPSSSQRIIFYPEHYRGDRHPGDLTGMLELHYNDIPAIRAALDQAEAIYRGESRPSENEPRCSTCDMWLGEGDHSHPPEPLVMWPCDRDADEMWVG